MKNFLKGFMGVMAGFGLLAVVVVIHDDCKTLKKHSNETEKRES